MKHGLTVVLVAIAAHLVAIAVVRLLEVTQSTIRKAVRGSTWTG